MLASSVFKTQKNMDEKEYKTTRGHSLTTENLHVNGFYNKLNQGVVFCCLLIAKWDK